VERGVDVLEDEDAERALLDAAYQSEDEDDGDPVHLLLEPTKLK